MFSIIGSASDSGMSSSWRRPAAPCRCGRRCAGLRFRRGGSPALRAGRPASCAAPGPASAPVRRYRRRAFHPASDARSGAPGPAAIRPAPPSCRRTRRAARPSASLRCAGARRC
ncbi:hypothetical protein G6F68_016886 [Rhizopus microsporus]|nr:hypothetical protein G6F68_016886 [Rhizopus microsporus]